MLRCALAEWQLARTRLVRSRLGLWLLLLVGGLVLVARHPVILALDTGMLAAVLAVAFTAGADSDRAALALTPTHPTTPLAVALRRWLAAHAVAGLCAGVARRTPGGRGGTRRGGRRAAAAWPLWRRPVGCGGEPPRGAGGDAPFRRAAGGSRGGPEPGTRRGRGARRSQRRGEDHAAAAARRDAAAR